MHNETKPLPMLYNRDSSKPGASRGSCSQGSRPPPPPPPPPPPSRLPSRIAGQCCDSGPAAEGWLPSNVGVAHHEGVPPTPAAAARQCAAAIGAWGGRWGLLPATAATSASRGGWPHLVVRKHSLMPHQTSVPPADHHEPSAPQCERSADTRLRGHGPERAPAVSAWRPGRQGCRQGGHAPPAAPFLVPRSSCATAV